MPYSFHWIALKSLLSTRYHIHQISFLGKLRCNCPSLSRTRAALKMEGWQLSTF